MGSKQNGVAVIIALLTVLILSTLGASIMFSTQAEITTTYNFKRLTQARYVAEAGAQSTVNWLIYNYTAPAPASFSSYDMTQSPVQYNNSPIVLSAMTGVTANYPDTTVQSAFNSALKDQAVSGLDVGVTYAATATLQTMRVVTPFGGSTPIPIQSWLINSTATLGGSQAQVAVTTTIEKFGSPVFSYAAFGVSATCGSVSFAGGSDTDSFDSSQGSYASTKQNTQGNIGSNGNISLAGSNTKINGTGSTPLSTSGNCTGNTLTGVSTTNGASIGGGQVTLSATASFATPAAPSPTPPTTTQNTNGTCGGFASGCSTVSGGIALAPGSYGNIGITAGTTVHLSQGIYIINSISLAGNSTLIVDSGPVVLNVNGASLNGNNAAVDLTGGTVSNTVSSKPSDFQILYAGSQPVKISGGSSSYGVIYTPSAPITVSGGSDWYGSVIGNTITDSGGTNIHYDRSLSSNLEIVGNYHTTAFGWSKY